MIEPRRVPAPSSACFQRARDLLLACLLVVAGLRAVHAAAPQTDALELWLRELERSVPREAADYSAATPRAVAKAANAVEQWMTQRASFKQARTPAEIHDVMRHLLEGKSRVDQLLDDAFDLRRQFSSLPLGDEQRAAARGYLRTTSQLIDLSGRLRYLHVDALLIAVPKLMNRPADRKRLIDLLIAHRSSAGAMIVTQQVLGPVAAPARAITDPAEAKKLLELIAVTGERSLLPQVIALLEGDGVGVELAVEAADVVRRIGLPQDPWPGTEEKLPPPAVTAERLHEILSRIEATSLKGESARRHTELLAWLAERRDKGLTEESYRVGTLEVRPGDWMLMRNPSPYNQFTDLSPGLFTHVGVATLERGADGIQRMVIVDLPERGSHIPATNVDAYLERTLHYCFLRHPNPAVAQPMAKAARDVIGNESQFDLNFLTSRVLDLKGQPLAGRKIHTYCAGLLMVCALQTPADRSEFFPIADGPAGGMTSENLAKLGLSIGQDFLSPTGALFSPKLEVVGRREAMYDPAREVEEAIFDHFAHLLATRTLVPSPDWFQSMRLKLAEASKHNPLLAEAIARAAKVSADTDLVSAAKAAAVVETLDEIAFGASAEFLDARDILLEGSEQELIADGADAEELKEVRAYRRRHSSLYDRVRRGQASRRQLRVELVDHYIRWGKAELERRFFSPAKSK
ncbi:MAG TPA: hypothetical protein VND64_34460 [Pirellulales bacterium]|nr:hypothetical protein [Pirellulales bacterium]